MRVAYASVKRKLSMTVVVVMSTGFSILSDRRSRGTPSLFVPAKDPRYRTGGRLHEEVV